MTVFDIIKQYLENNSIDGLVTEVCGCHTDDLAPCGDGPYHDCERAKVLKVNEDRRITNPFTGEVINCWAYDPGDDYFVPYPPLEN